ncbi:adenylate kinase [Dactylosporangium sp. NPDC049525]|uniref:adenylate kinase n=1 Tax=Dactylosporangium sp. NPDC049525 TaxID=3154730 RepID=UPI003429C4C7
MRIGIIGPPGAGKGTQAALIAAHFDVPYIGTGDMLRDHVARGTDVGRAVRSYLDRGELVPDEIVCDTLREAFTDAIATGGGYVLDGMPRTMNQARAIYKVASELGMTTDVALHLKADDETVRRRMLARSAVEHRSDDTEPVIQHRLDLYHRVTEPILAWYAFRGILLTVDVTRTAAQVGREILVALEVMRPLLDSCPEKLRRSVDLTALTPTA